MIRDTKKHQKPRLSFKLTTLFVAIALVAISSAFVGRLRGRQLRQRANIERIRDRLQADVFRTKPVDDSWLWRLLAVEDVERIHVVRGHHQLNLSDMDDLILSGVERLHLSGTQINDAWLVRFKDSKLTRVVISDCSITDRGFVKLPLEGVKDGITVVNSPLSDSSVKYIGRECRSLSRLSLNGTNITDAGLPALRATSIEALYLSNTKITDTGLEEIGLHGELRILHLDDTAITDEGVIELASTLPLLQKLKIRNCKQISSGCLQSLVGHPELRRVEVAGTSISYEDAISICGKHKDVLVRTDPVFRSKDDMSLLEQRWQEMGGLILLERPNRPKRKSFVEGGMF